MLYEAMLLFGVLFVAGMLFSILLQQRNALHLRHLLQDWLFLVIGLYFIGFWTNGGQTLAMKTWRIRLVTRNGGKVGILRAIARYLLTWLWILPGLAFAWKLDAHHWALVLLPLVNFLLWALLIYLDPDHQFLHDRLTGTRLIGIEDEHQQMPGR